MAKFFDIICKALFILLLAINKVKRWLLEPISNNFATIKINRYEIFYLYYLI